MKRLAAEKLPQLREQTIKRMGREIDATDGQIDAHV